jgi:hypothetical protein
MDGRKDALNDMALEQEVEALLSVEPSPDFGARVRSRVATEAASSGWGWRWPIAAVATAMALIVVVVALWRSVDPVAPSTSAPSQRAAAPDVVGPTVIPPHDEPVEIRVPRQRAHVVAAVPGAIELALPPVIIAENETRAYGALVADRRATRFEFSSSVARAVENPIELDKMPRVDPVALEPLEIKPLVKVVELE